MKMGTTIISLIVQTRKEGHRKVKKDAHGHRGIKVVELGSELGQPGSKPLPSMKPFKSWALEPMFQLPLSWSSLNKWLAVKQPTLTHGYCPHKILSLWACFLNKGITWSWWQHRLILSCRPPVSWHHLHLTQVSNPPSLGHHAHASFQAFSYPLH